MPQRIAALLLIFLGFSSVLAQTAKQQKVWEKTFEIVWKTVNEKHFDPKFGGVDWPAVGEEFRPKARQARSEAEFHAVLREMLGRLGVSHFAILPPKAQITANLKDRGVTGISVISLGDKFIVERVAADSAAAIAGIRPGAEIISLNEKPIEEVLRPLNTALKARNASPALTRRYLERAVEDAVNGKPGVELTAEFEAGDGTLFTRTLLPRAFNGEMSKAFGNFPPQEVIFESKMLADQIGYIRFNIWVMPQIGKIKAAMRELAAARGIIFDIRGNPGGIGAMAPAIAGFLTDRQMSLGKMNMREMTTSFVAVPQPRAFTRPVVILVNNGSASTSEVFAAGLQENGRATIVGVTTAGAVLPSVFEKLPTDWLFQYAVADYRSPRNILVEGKGVLPDVVVEQSRTALLAGRDVQLEKAIETINAKTAEWTMSAAAR